MRHLLFKRWIAGMIGCACGIMAMKWPRILRQQNYYTTSAEKEAPRMRHLLFKRWIAGMIGRACGIMAMKWPRILRQQNYYTTAGLLLHLIL